MKDWKWDPLESKEEKSFKNKRTANDVNVTERSSLGRLKTDPEIW